MKGDAKVIDYLNKALHHELTAISQYWLHYRLQDDWGLGSMAKKSREEMQHADKLIERILFLGDHPNLQNLDPLRIDQTLKETLECDLAAEMDARALYKEARDACNDAGGYVSMKLFEELMADEEGHIVFLETQIELHDRIGAENYAQLNAAKMAEVED